ncbi:MAG TPA: AraC family transcriptional regulator [Gemmatimonadaceae bacterium]|nr:AraC family transcriptional regulator [Gemmatimonadaceae bacterium]
MVDSSGTDRGSRYRARMMSVPGFSLYRGMHPQGTELPRHSHDDPTLCYVLRGRFTEYVAGRAVDCLSDSLKVTPAGEMHSDRFAARETHGLRIDVDRGRFTESRSIHQLLDEQLHLSGAHAGRIVNRLLAELDAGDESAAIAVEGLLLELLATLARDVIPVRGAAIQPWLREADDIIRELYASQIALSGVARAVGVAPATLARSYRSAFRLTVGERIRQLRMERAVRDLLESEEPLSSIALRAGFYDQSHFTNLFRRRFGVTPAQYRLASRRRVS